MAFTRKFLTDNGVPEDKVDIIMAERNRTLSDYIPKSDVDAQIAAAIENAKKDAPAIDIFATEEYKKLLAENEKIKAFQTDDFAAVKKPYRDIVWEKLEHGDKHKPYAEQLTALAETLPDLFAIQQEQAKPQFGAETAGKIPTGNGGNSFSDVWKFIPNQKG